MPTVTRTLIIINVVVFLLQQQVGEATYINFALWPLGASPFSNVPGFQPWQVVTYAFLHGSLTHIFFNMFALYMFGGPVERVLGAARFLNLYLASIIAAALTQLLVAAFMTGPAVPVVGASGGVFGLLFAYALYFPNNRILLLFPPIPMPARVFVFVYGAIELTLGVTGYVPGVAHFAHLGGILGAWLVIRFGSRRRP